MSEFMRRPQQPEVRLGAVTESNLFIDFPYFRPADPAEVLGPQVADVVHAILPGMVGPAVTDAVAMYAVLRSGSTMTGALILSPVITPQPNQAISYNWYINAVSDDGIY